MNLQNNLTCDDVWVCFSGNCIIVVLGHVLCQNVEIKAIKSTLMSLMIIWMLVDAILSHYYHTCQYN